MLALDASGTVVMRYIQQARAKAEELLPDVPEREALLALLNGACGLTDHMCSKRPQEIPRPERVFRRASVLPRSNAAAAAD